MRVFYAAAASLAVVAGADAFSANVVGMDTTGTNTFVGGTVLPDMYLRRDGARHQPAWERSGADVGNSRSAAKAHDAAIRLAAILPITPAAEATTGNPSVAPLKWVGLLVIPEPTPQAPNEIGLCTAQFIKPNVLLTAGHCLKDLPANPAGPWPDPTKGNFWLQYQNEVGYAYNIVCAMTRSSLDAAVELRRDDTGAEKYRDGCGVAARYRDDPGERNRPTGVMPYALDWKGKYTSAYRVGYPNAILDSAIVQKVPGSVFFASDIPMGGNSLPNLVVQWGPITDATQGMSGGGWIANFNVSEGANNNILIAVSSYHDTNFPGAEFGAYLTAAEFNPLLATVSNGCK